MQGCVNCVLCCDIARNRLGAVIGTIRWKCSASRSPTRCRHLTTSAASSATVHSRCTHCECCGTMASAKLVFRQFSGRSLCLGWHTQRQRGLDLSPAQTTSTSKHSFTGASDVDTARQICQTLFSWWRKRTSSYLEESTTIQATSCADCSRPRRWWHSSTACGVVHMTDKCPITQDTDKNFLIRMLYKDSYWLFLYCKFVILY